MPPGRRRRRSCATRDVVAGEHVIADDPPRLAHAERGRGVVEEGVGEAGNVRLEEGSRLLGQPPPFELTPRRLAHVGDVDRRSVAVAYACHRADELAGAERRDDGTPVARKVRAVLADEVAEFGYRGHRGRRVDVLHDELHRPELARAGRAELGGDAGEGGDVGVAGAVDEDLPRDRARAALGREHERAHHAVVYDDLGDERVQQHLERVLLGDEMVGETLDCPRHVQEDGGLLERHRSDARTVAGERVGDLPCDAAHDELEFAPVAAHVQPADRPDLGDREVPSEKAVPLAEDDAGAGAGGRDRRAQTGRSTAGHDDVGVGKDVGLTLGDTHSRKVPPHLGMRSRRRTRGWRRRQ